MEGSTPRARRTSRAVRHKRLCRQGRLMDGSKSKSKSKSDRNRETKNVPGIRDRWGVYSVDLDDSLLFSSAQKSRHGPQTIPVLCLKQTEVVSVPNPTEEQVPNNPVVVPPPTNLVAKISGLVSQIKALICLDLGTTWAVQL